jgi:hypothetical protein
MKKQAYIILLITVFFGLFSCKTIGEAQTRPDNALLIKIKEDLAIGFSSPVKTDFLWITTKAGAETVDRRVSGFKISARIELNGDYSFLNEKAKMVADYLTSKGFTVSEYNISETAGGYERDNLVCLIMTQSDSESDMYANLVIECGQLQ